jgi:hypothetical protein
MTLVKQRDIPDAHALTHNEESMVLDSQQRAFSYYCAKQSAVSRAP